MYALREARLGRILNVPGDSSGQAPSEPRRIYIVMDGGDWPVMATFDKGRGAEGATR
jgi:hypothetical protein